MVAKLKTKKGTEKNIIYPNVKVEVHDSSNPITEEKMKSILGWIDNEEEAVKLGLKEPDTIDLKGQKVWLTNNKKNRPIHSQNVLSLQQELLNSRWKLNGEPIIIGQEGTVLNGQHSGIALILANQLRELDPHWKGVHKEPITMQKVIVYGIEENDIVVNTMDTCKPRSLSDVIYRSHLFEKYQGSERKHLASILDKAIRLLWYRTGVVSDPYASRRTHSEAMAFAENHKNLLGIVRSVYIEDSGTKGGIAKYLPLGPAAAMLYLMASSNSDGEKYRTKSIKNEKGLNFDQEEKATSFFIHLAAGNDTPGGKKLEAVREALALCQNLGEKLAVISLAWIAYSKKGKVEKDQIDLKFTINEKTGTRTLNEVPDVGGLDMGDPNSEKWNPVEEELPEETEEESETEEVEETEE